jgi:hypothetical protein
LIEFTFGHPQKLNFIMKKYMHFTKRAAILSAELSLLALLPGCYTINHWMGNDSSVARSITKIDSPRHTPEMNPKGGTPGTPVASTTTATASDQAPHTSGSREFDPYDYYGSGGEEVTPPNPEVTGEPGKYVPQSAPASAPGKLFGQSEVRKPINSNPYAAQGATVASPTPVIVPMAPTPAASTEVPPPAAKLSDNTPQNNTPDNTPSESATATPSDVIVPEPTPLVTPAPEPVLPAPVKVTTVIVPKPSKDAPVPTSAHTAESSTLPTANARFLPLPKQMQAAPAEQTLPLAPAPEAKSVPAADAPAVAPDASGDTDDKTSAAPSQGSWISRTMGAFHGHSDDTTGGAQATDQPDSNTPYPALSSVPKVPAEYKGIKSEQQGNMQELQTGYSAAQQDKQNLNSEPSDSAPASASPTSAVSTTVPAAQPKLLGHVSAPVAGPGALLPPPQDSDKDSDSSN